MAAAAPTDNALRKGIKELLEGQDLSQLNLRILRQRLEGHMQLPEGYLEPHKSKVKELTAERVQEIQAEQSAAAPAEGENDADAAEDAPDAPAEEAAASSSKAAKRKRNEDGVSTKQRQKTMFSKQDFLKSAEEIRIPFGGKTLKASPRTFSTGSMGWFLSGKHMTTVGEKDLQCQITVNIAVVGSKEWAES